ncbi:hypothetical protein Taro_021203, partial [Colocasia esculenta]|nr:hypothetical protein [Colocasia esculenta]
LSSVCSPHVVSCFGSSVTVEPDGRVLFNLYVEYVPVGQDDGVVKLADLGCAAWMDDGCQGRGIISGTPLYMAPEVARGEVQGPAVDIWALGCTVIEMAIGYPPWRDVQDPVTTIHRIAFSEDVPEFPCNLSDDARDFRARCLSKDPRKRWSAEELLSHSFLKHSGDSPRSACPRALWI